MLDEFTPETKKPTIPAGKPKAPAEDPLLGDEVSDDDFANQLQAGMADLLGELDSSPEMKAQFENMLKELGGAGGLGAEALGGILTAPTAGGQTASSAPSTDGSSKPQTNTKFNRDVPSVVPQDESFQDTIKKTMERMKASGDSATAAATSDNSDDLLAEMMKAMGNMDGEGSEEDFSKMLLGMMEQLTNKEILYEPMKELHDKFPSWMKKNAGKVDAADMKRYKEQQVYVREIVGKFEEKTYRDENVKDREYIVERMQNVSTDPAPRVYLLLMDCRCKQLAHHHLILLAIWQRPRKRLVV